MAKIRTVYFNEGETQADLDKWLQDNPGFVRIESLPEDKQQQVRGWAALASVPSGCAGKKPDAIVVQSHYLTGLGDPEKPSGNRAFMLQTNTKREGNKIVPLPLDRIPDSGGAS